MILNFVVLFPLFSAVWADTPANCTYNDIIGSWIFTESAFQSKETPCASISDEEAHTVTVHLAYPNEATDSFGNTGYWTLIYNQGFEVVVHGRKYFAFSKYDQNASYCDETMPGRSHDLLGHNWACFNGMKNGNAFGRKAFVKNDLTHEKAESFLYATSPKFVDKINHNTKTWNAYDYPEHKYKTVADMVRMAGGKNSRSFSKPKAAKVTAEQHRLTNYLPDDFDWRNVDGQNFVSPVRNQGHCGSCYSFASLAMLEARVRILSNNSQQPVFSPQDVVECSNYSQGCEGGFAYLIAGKYAEDFGVVDESCNPYTGKDGQCTTTKTCHRYYSSRYQYVGGYYGGCNEKSLQLALYHNGPIAIGFEVTQDFFKYKGGIYQVPSSQDMSHTTKFNPFEMTNHAVLLVGWGKEGGIPYWIVKNSWGGFWGEKGYFRIMRGRDELGIESMGLESFPML